MSGMLGGFGVGNNATGDVVLTLAMPDSVPDLSLLIACIMTRSLAGVTHASWTEDLTLRGDDDQLCRNYIFTRIADTEPVSYTFDLDVSAKACGVIVAVLGAEPTPDIFDDASLLLVAARGAGDPDGIWATPLSLKHDGTLLLWFGATASTNVVTTPPPGMMFGADANSSGNPVSSNVWVGACYQENAPAGPTDDMFALATNTAVYRHCVALAVRPGGSGPPSLSVPYTSRLS
jgi:hypothetical protein